MSGFTSLALEKLDKELKGFKGGKCEGVIKSALHRALEDFCRQDDEFAQAVAQSDKTLSDCAAAAVKGCGSGISDIEVYKRAVQFYFPGADIRMTMELDLCGGAGIGNTASGMKILDLSDFL